MSNSSCSGWLCYMLKRKLTSRENPLTRIFHGSTDKMKQKKENLITQILFLERKTGLKPATLSLEG